MSSTAQPRNHQEPGRAWTASMAALAFCLVLLQGGQARAETLVEALVSAYASNPTLKAERARLRSTDEGVPQALSGWRPTIISNGDASHVRNEVSPGSNTDASPYGFSVTITQPIFRGFQTINGTAQAEKLVLAGQQTLLRVEQAVLFDAVTAYMNVVRDLTIVNLRGQNVANLEEQLKGTRARFDVGELTQTDVAQSRARLSEARSDYATARSNLAASRADYARLVGHLPTNLRFPRSIRSKLPKTLEEAIREAEARNPQIMEARYNEEASAHAVDVAIGDLLPSADVQAQYSHQENSSSTIDDTDTVSVIGQVTVPIYQAGRESSEVRQAKHINHQQKLLVFEAIRAVRDDVVTAWNQWTAARQSILSDADQVKANELAYRGIQQEALVGSRTILDVLDTNRDLIDSQVLLISSRRDEVVASYLLLSALGRLTAQGLTLPVGIYDPSANLDKVRHKFFGIGIDESQ